MSDAHTGEETPLLDGDPPIDTTRSEEGTTATLIRLLFDQQRALVAQQDEFRRQHREAMELQAAQQRTLKGIVRSQQEALAKQSEEMSRMLSWEAMKPKVPKPTLQRLEERDDIEDFLDAFERIAKQQNWPEAVWATQVAGLLTGKALAAYTAMSAEESSDYQKVKRAMLHRYEVNEETHRLCFRRERKWPEESYRAWIYRITDYFDKWMKDHKLAVRDVMIMEQVLTNIPTEMAVWLKEHKPGSLDELSRLADEYALARKGEAEKMVGLANPPGPVKALGPLQMGRSVGNKPESSRGRGEGHSHYPPVDKGRTQVNLRGDKRCYHCGQWGHLRYSCPNQNSKDQEARLGKTENISLFAEACQDVAWNEDSTKYLRRGAVNGRPVQMLVDTGSDCTIVAARVVKDALLDPNSKVPILCVHGDVCL